MYVRKEQTYPERREEPAVLSSLITLLKQLLHCLLRILTLAGLLEGLRLDGALQSLELECVSCGEEVSIVYRLAE